MPLSFCSRHKIPREGGLSRKRGAGISVGGSLHSCVGRKCTLSLAYDVPLVMCVLSSVFPRRAAGSSSVITGHAITGWNIYGMQEGNGRRERA